MAAKLHPAVVEVAVDKIAVRRCCHLTNWRYLRPGPAVAQSRIIKSIPTGGDLLLLIPFMPRLMGSSACRAVCGDGMGAVLVCPVVRVRQIAEA